MTHEWFPPSRMDFILKKIIGLFLTPLPLGVALIALAIFFLWRQKKERAVGILLFAIVWFSLFSYTPFANYLLHRFESAYPPLMQAPPQTEYIYVLGVGHKKSKKLPITSQLGDDAIIRLNEAMRLYNQLHQKAKIIVSGYSGLYSDIPHAFMQRRLAVALGVNPKDIIALPEPRDTQEEAKAAKKLIGSKAFILVSSAYHMKRAMEWFEREGLHPVPAPAHHLTTDGERAYTDIYSTHALMLSTIFFHELMGIIWQKIKGI